MSKRDWFRKSSWTAADKKDFFDHLSRAKSPHSMAQYLRIQASHLQSDLKPPDPGAALELLDLMLKDHPDSSEVGMAHLQRAKCLEALNRHDEALYAYLRAVKADVNPFGIHTTDAPFHFAMFVIKHGLRRHHNDVLAALRGAEVAALMPENQYRMCVAMAVIASENNQKKEASDYAKKALRVAESLGASPGTIDAGIHRRVAGLADRPT